MRKPWSISTTVRNPERLRNFLRVLKQLEGKEFTSDNQIRYQILLIKERLYTPNNIPDEYREYYENPTKEMPYDVAKEIFMYQNYRDPPMRGRQSANPLNKLGFAIARAHFGPIKITELGNLFLAGNYDIGYIFFKSLLKLQFPNPWSTHFSAEDGFNITPFIATLHLMYKLNKRSDINGLSKEEFCVFIPTLINADQIDYQIEKIIEFRELTSERRKKQFITDFVRDFYEVDNIPEKKINNLFDYGDNAMRYFRLTRYFHIQMDSLKRYWRIDLAPSRLAEIKQLIAEYNGKAREFRDVNEYLDYISDINQPQLPWERLANLRKIATNLKTQIINTIEKNNLQLTEKEQSLIKVDIIQFDKKHLNVYINELRALNLNLRLKLKKKELLGNIDTLQKIIMILEDNKLLRKLEPEEFEKLLADALKILNDELLIKPNYPMGDDGEPISHAPGNRPDIECYYHSFNAICEVTLNCSSLQWVQEGQPVMRHLRDFEIQHSSKDAFCLFIAPKIHRDTYSQFWISVKYEYDGKPQKIIPMTAKQFAVLLKKLLTNLKSGRKFSHKGLYKLYSDIINETRNANSFSEWARKIDKILKKWIEVN